MQLTTGKQSVLFPNSIQETPGLGKAALLSKDNSLPKAYINYLFFDKENNFKSGGYQQVSEEALGSFEELSLDFTPEEEGTMMIYTANQTAEDLDVYMDDMMMLHTEGPIIRVDDYYPFGLTFNSSERSGFTTNKFLYQGKEIQSDLGLDTYDFHARMYDPVLGRTFQLDPHLENYYDWSPYSWTGDNPISMIDPTGMDWFYNDQTGETFYHSSLQKGAEEEMIEGWQWMGANNMFKGEDDQQLSGEDVVDANIDLVTYGEETENADGETSTMAFFAGENGKKFMDKMGFDFVPTQQVIYESDFTFGI